MKESASLLDSKVAMQIRYLEMVKNLGEKNGVTVMMDIGVDRKGHWLICAVYELIDTDSRWSEEEQEEEEGEGEGESGAPTIFDGCVVYDGGDVAGCCAAWIWGICAAFGGGNVLVWGKETGICEHFHSSLSQLLLVRLLIYNNFSFVDLSFIAAAIFWSFVIGALFNRFGIIRPQ